MSAFRFANPPYATSDGRWMPVRWDGKPPVQPALTDDDILDAADRFCVPAAHIDAVHHVETRKSGFLVNEPRPARPAILFEAHWFYKLTPKPVSHTRPDLASHHWIKSLYKGGSAEWSRLADAYRFDPTQALKSASYGIGQVMGFNYRDAGCDSIEQMVEEAFESEHQQLRHMLNYCAHHDLLEPLAKGHWTLFALAYNGTRYKVNDYDTRLAEAAKSSRFA